MGQALCRELAARDLPFRAISRQSGPGYTGIGTYEANTDWAPVLTGITCVVHLAARVHVMNERTSDPLAAFRATNVDATLNLARQAAACGVKRFVFLSSIKVNGDRTETGAPFRPDQAPNPPDAYGISKHEAEQGLLGMPSTNIMPVTIIRPPLVYGPGVKANFLRLMTCVNRNVPLPLGAIKNLRSIISTDNLVDLIIAAADHPAAANRVLLAADGEDISTTRMLKLVAKGLGKSPCLMPVPESLLYGLAKITGQGEVAKRVLGSLQVDLTQTRSLLSWTPPVSVESGLRRAARAFLDQK